MKEGTKTLTLRVSDETAQQLKRKAEADNRSVNNLIAVFIRKMLDEQTKETA